MTLQPPPPPPPPPTTHPHKLKVSNISADFDETLKVGSWEHLEQTPTVTVTFVQATFVRATFVLVTFVHIKNISAVTDPILMKLYRYVPGNI